MLTGLLKAALAAMSVTTCFVQVGIGCMCPFFDKDCLVGDGDGDGDGDFDFDVNGDGDSAGDGDGHGDGDDDGDCDKCGKRARCSSRHTRAFTSKN